jgi:hypothetical protein
LGKGEGVNNTSVILEAIKRNPEMKYGEIGKFFGVTKSYVQKIAKDGGLPSRKARPRNYRSDITVEKVLNLYNNTSMLIKEIALALDCNQVTVKSRLRQARITKKKVYSRRARILNPQWIKRGGKQIYHKRGRYE